MQVDEDGNRLDREELEEEDPDSITAVSSHTQTRYSLPYDMMSSSPSYASRSAHDRPSRLAAMPSV